VQLVEVVGHQVTVLVVLVLLPSVVVVAVLEVHLLLQQ
jgi:hypothetical protein